jgi:hypothetical protein
MYYFRMEADGVASRDRDDDHGKFYNEIFNIIITLNFRSCARKIKNTSTVLQSMGHSLIFVYYYC